MKLGAVPEATGKLCGDVGNVDVAITGVAGAPIVTVGVVEEPDPVPVPEVLPDVEPDVVPAVSPAVAVIPPPPPPPQAASGNKAARTASRGNVLRMCILAPTGSLRVGKPCVRPHEAWATD